MRWLSTRTPKPPGGTHAVTRPALGAKRSEEHTSELQSPCNLVCRLLLEKKKKTHTHPPTPLTHHLPLSLIPSPRSDIHCSITTPPHGRLHYVPDIYHHPHAHLATFAAL